jgi:hypothetical protein
MTKRSRLARKYPVQILNAFENRTKNLSGLSPKTGSSGFQMLTVQTSKLSFTTFRHSLVIKHPVSYNLPKTSLVQFVH